MMTFRKLLLMGPLIFLTLWAIARADQKILYEKDSAYNHILVKEDEDGLRSLLFEKYGALQSVVRLGDPDHLELPYAKAMPLGLVFVESPPRQALIIGLGGGTIPNFLHKHYPEMTIDVVDIDPDVIAVAKRYFGFQEDGQLQAYAADGRKFIEKSGDRYDLIFLDAYGADSIPYHLATKEFLRAVRKILSPKGTVVGNVWSRASNKLYDSMVRTYQDVFDDTYVFDVPGSGNKIFIGVPRKGKIGKEEVVRRAGEISKKEEFRFDLGEIASYGYNRMTEERIEAPVLLDEKKAEEKAESTPK